MIGPDHPRSTDKVAIMMRNLMLIIALALCVSACAMASQTRPQPTRPTAPQTRAPQAPNVPAAIGQPTQSTSRTAARASVQRPMLCMWINRWDYRSYNDVDEAIARAASLGVTDIFWQVRGRADAFYPSSLEPWGEEICTNAAGRMVPPPAGFDPLRRAVDQAHARGLRLHAWLNVMPLWKGKSPPTDQSHVYHTRPGWRIREANGTPQQLHDHYVIVNFARRDVQDHIIAVCKDVLTRYNVDGLHMDYIRYVSETFDAKLRYMHDPDTLAQFGRDARVDPSRLSERDLHDQMHRWRTNLVTMLVRRVRSEAMPVRSGAQLSAAVWRSPSVARDTYAQDAERWLNEGLLDFACPMIYSDKNADFDRDVSEWAKACPGRAVVPGIGIYMHKPGTSGPQLATSRQQCPTGIALYAYASLFDSADPKQDKSAKASKERLDRLTDIRANLTRMR